MDIGDKSWGVRACQQYFGGIERTRTLHVGDQFLSAGANDFKVSLHYPYPYRLLTSSGPFGFNHRVDCESEGDSSAPGRAGGIGKGQLIEGHCGKIIYQEHINLSIMSRRR